MGLVAVGAPFDIIPDLARLSGIKSFVETGTLFGGTSRAAATYFQSVFTVEKARGLYEKYSDGLRQVGNIEPLFGDSKSVLPEILARLGDESAVFWLDGHWSGGETAGQEDECPVLVELEILSKRTGDIILIDDARLFMSAPAAPHDIAQWPTLLEIAETLLRRHSRPYVQVIDDVIFIVPNNPKLVDCLVKYGRERSKGFWKAYDSGRPRRPLFRRVAHRLTRLLPMRKA